MAPIHRAVLDAARRMSRIDDVRALLAEAVQRRLTTVAALRRELEEGSCRGTALVRRVLVEIEDGTRSGAEAWCRKIVAEMAGFPPVIWNVASSTPTASFLASSTGSSTRSRLAIEIDSFEHHADPEAFDATHETPGPPDGRRRDRRAGDAPPAPRRAGDGEASALEQARAQATRPLDVRPSVRR